MIDCGKWVERARSTESVSSVFVYSLIDSLSSHSLTSESETSALCRRVETASSRGRYAEVLKFALRYTLDSCTEVNQDFFTLMSTDVEVRLKDEVSLRAKPRYARGNPLTYIQRHITNHIRITYGGDTVQLLTLSIGLKSRSGVNDAPPRDNELPGYLPGYFPPRASMTTEGRDQQQYTDWRLIPCNILSTA